MTDEGALAAPFHEVVPFGPDTDEPTPRKTRAEVAVEALKAAPNLVKLCFRLLSDPRVPRRTKVLLGVSGLYVLSPIDLIPELLLPVVGRVDDLLVVAFALHRLLDAVDPSVLDEYWDGDGDALELVTAFIAWGAELMPAPFKRLLDG
jgi:uncharacterized membrane protein YkvA (DUF1232 family)